MRYRSGGAPGKYSVIIGTADTVEVYTAEPVLFTRTLAGKVTITGAAKVGETLTADISELINAASTLTYQWYRGEQPINGANSRTYTLVAEDGGKTITVRVTADEIYASGSVISDATEEVIKNYAVNIGSFTGGTVTASSTTAAAGETIGLTIVPDTGMLFKEGSLKYNDGTEDHEINGTSFVMPAADVTVTAEFVAITYTVNIGTLYYGIIYVTPFMAAAGETVNLTVIPDEGRRLKPGSLKYNDGTGEHEIDGTSFTMPAANVEITAEFERLYTVSVAELSGGSITASPATAAAGETISLTITPDADKRFLEGSMRYYDGTGYYSISGSSFVMPAANIIITAEFGMILPTYYVVNIGPLSGGSISAVPAAAMAGETICLYITPGEGMMFIKGSLKYNDGTGEYVINGTSFTMPDADVTVTATFSINKYAVTWIDGNGETIYIEQLEHGSTPVYDKATYGVPQKAATAQYTYSFTGWSPAVGTVNKDIVYTAQFNSFVNKYTVTFKDYDGTELSTQEVEYGGAATAPAEPSRTGYAFAGWDKSFNNIDSDIEINALYTTKELNIDILSIDDNNIKINVQNNESGLLIVAFYDAYGKMVTAGTNMVTNNAGNIDIRCVGLSGLPAIYSIKIFILNSHTYVPLYYNISSIIKVD